MNNPTIDLTQAQSTQAENGAALIGVIAVTSLVMVAAVRWAATGASYGAFLASLGIATLSSLLLSLALWILPGDQAPRSQRRASALSHTT